MTPEESVQEAIQQANYAKKIVDKAIADQKTALDKIELGLKGAEKRRFREVRKQAEQITSAIKKGVNPDILIQNFKNLK